jgi:hypothetical protein
MAKRRKIGELIADQYEDKAVADAVAKEVQKLGTAARIESGELTLPTEQDARSHFERVAAQQEEDRRAGKANP